MVRTSSPLLLTLHLAAGRPGRPESRSGPPVRLGPGSAAAPRSASPSEDVGPASTPIGSGCTARTGFTASSPASMPSSSTSTGRSSWSPGRSRRRSSTWSPTRSASARRSRARAEYEETGSGVIVRGEGTEGLFVLTNNHVVAGAAPRPDRHLPERRPVVPPGADLARQQGRHRRAQARPRPTCPPPGWATATTRPVGSWVLAMGSPFGLTHSVSQGIISGRGRHEVDLENATASRTRTSSRPTPRSTRATRAGRW